MFDRLFEVWLPCLLFLVTVALAVALAGIVLLAPFLDENPTGADGWSRLLAIFARDTTVRRTALASSLGLLVTAFVFFRPGLFRASGKKSRNKQPPPVVGA